MRTIRAVLLTALIWGCFWAMVGGAVGVAAALYYGPGDLAYIVSMSLTPIAMLGTAGLLAGATFAAVMSRTERGERLDTMSIRRAAKWGAVGGLTFSLAGLTLVTFLFGIQEVMVAMSLIWTGVAATCGAVSAAGSLAIARKGTPGLLEEAEGIRRLRAAE